MGGFIIKRFFATILAAALALSLTACDSKDYSTYRLGDEDGLFDIGWEDYLNRGGVCAVEWSERIAGALPPETIKVTISRCPGNARTAQEAALAELSSARIFIYLPPPQW